MNLVRRHGGCEITSDDPLEIRTCDNEIEVIVSPANLIARMGWLKPLVKPEKTVRDVKETDYTISLSIIV
jgi:hypothetical protein